MDQKIDRRLERVYKALENVLSLMTPDCGPNCSIGIVYPVGGIWAIEGMGNLTIAQANMIQAFADRYGVTVDVVGSRAAGTATAASDFDYVITGGNSAVRRAARTELPRGTAGGELRTSGAESGRDIFNGTITPTDTSRPYIRFLPTPKGD